MNQYTMHGLGWEKLCRSLLVWLLGGVTFWAWIGWGHAEAKTVRIEVLAYRPEAMTQRETQGLKDALEKVLPQHKFEVHPANYDGLIQSLQDRRVDFVLTNPSSYLHIKSHVNLTAPLATWTSGLHPELQQFGGVILVRASRLDLQNISDLEGERSLRQSIHRWAHFRRRLMNYSRRVFCLTLITP